MKKFEFSSKSNDEAPIFCGEVFYSVYNDAEFLRQSDNIETILSKGYELRKTLKEVEPGQRVAVGGMMLAKNTPLIVMKTGPNVVVESYEFTANRLTGLVAAYAFDNRSRFPDLKSSEALALGLTWDNGDEKKCKLYLSAVSGTEHFDKQFQFWPLVCGLRKLQLKKITIEPIIKMAKIKNQNGVRMANQLMRNLAIVRDLWSYFPGTSNADFKNQIECLPLELKKLFFNMK
ncbi:uncharacterized protein [Maniola hyperantus]|nr:uncharacterized protein LOC117989960 [Maniola hyperantus]XP_034833247.1 uncharacterized protein LOC117989960 [Maniola hyperantus]XP_034833248.1 uncharacterized protein LOC117989960 [Maniola hyperantus]